MKDELKTTKYLRVNLTDEEKLAAGNDMGRESVQLQQAKEKKKETTSQLTAEVDRHQAEVSRLGQLLANGYEYRDVQCLKVIDHVSDRVTITREDTGEIVEDRKRRPDEMQAEMALD